MYMYMCIHVLLHVYTYMYIIFYMYLHNIYTIMHKTHNIIYILACTHASMFYWCKIAVLHTCVQPTTCTLTLLVTSGFLLSNIFPPK